MQNTSQLLGIQSYSLRHCKDNVQVAEQIRACGVSVLELSGVHADFDDPEACARAVQPFLDAGIAIPSLGVNWIEDTGSRATRWFETAHRIGTRYMSISFQPESSPATWRFAERMAEKYDLLLGIHNHGGWDWLGSRRMLSHVLKNTNERVGLCLDTAWALDSGENVYEMIETFSERLYGMHLKDFVFDRARKPEDVVIGTGNIELARLVPLLTQLPALGFAVIEYEKNPENPLPALQASVQAILAALQPAENQRSHHP